MKYYIYFLIWQLCGQAFHVFFFYHILKLMCTWKTIFEMMLNFIYTVIPRIRLYLAKSPVKWKISHAPSVNPMEKLMVAVSCHWVLYFGSISQLNQGFVLSEKQAKCMYVVQYFFIYFYCNHAVKFDQRLIPKICLHDGVTRMSDTGSKVIVERKKER